MGFLRNDNKTVRLTAEDWMDIIGLLRQAAADYDNTSYHSTYAASLDELADRIEEQIK
jgi:hypothetical protein